MIDAKDAARRLSFLNARERAALDARRTQAQAAGLRLAERILKEIPGTRAVLGFGSTWELWRNYRKTSDIDLAMEGGDLLAAMALVEGNAIPVDVLELSSCPPRMADFIRANGTLLAGVIEPANRDNA